MENKDEAIQESISILEDRKGQLCFQRVKLDRRIEALQKSIDELLGKNGKIKQE